MDEKTKHFYEFEGFCLDAENVSLWQGGKPVSITSKSLQTLILLVKRGGEIVSREELLDTVWKDTFVEEGNINYTISMLRKTLGNKDIIQTVPRRGYRFVADTRETSRNGTTPNQPSLTPQPVVRRPVFWLLATVCVLSLAFLTSVAFWTGGRKSARLSDSTQSQNFEAMQAYTRGNMIFEDKDNKNRDEKAIDEFQRAITLDPTFALAYVGLAEVYSRKGKSGSNESGQENFAKARTAVEKALSLDPSLAEAYSVAGWIKHKADWDFEGAENDLRRANHLNPDIARTHFRLSHVLSPLGKHDEALAEIKRAYELDPISEMILVAHFPILESRGEIDEALQVARRFHQDNKENPQILRALGTFFYHKGDFAKVIDMGQANRRANNAFAWLSLMAASYHKMGQTDKRDEALQELESLAASDTKALYSLAMNYAEMGRTDDAILALQKCYETREERMVWVNVEPRFANLKGDARFGEIVRKLRLV